MPKSTRNQYCPPLPNVHHLLLLVTLPSTALLGVSALAHGPAFAVVDLFRARFPGGVVAVGVPMEVFVTVGVAVGVAVTVAVFVIVGVFVMVGVFVTVGVFVAVGVFVIVDVAVGVAVGPVTP